MIDLHQLRELIIRPALRDLKLWSPSAEALVIGTGLIESGFTYLRQMPNGPALGFWQMEPATHDDLWVNYLYYADALSDRRRMAAAILAEVSEGPRVVVLRKWIDVGWRPESKLLMTNISYAVMCCRLQYWRDPQPLPEATDIMALAAYWKRVWNTIKGGGNPDKFVALYKEHVE